MGCASRTRGGRAGQRARPRTRSRKSGNRAHSSIGRPSTVTHCRLDVGAWSFDVVSYAVAILLRRKLAGVSFADIDLQARLGNLGTISLHLVGDRKAFHRLVCRPAPRARVSLKKVLVVHRNGGAPCLQKGPVPGLAARAKRSFKVGSCDTPKKANGAIRAPELVPLTMENSGRFPASVQPTNKPAPNAFQRRRLTTPKRQLTWACAAHR
jgi:hypothetical protein